jgi:hypothetical protein
MLVRTSPAVPQYNFPNKIALGSPISLSRFIRGVLQQYPQYIFSNTYMKGGSHMSGRENMVEK